MIAVILAGGKGNRLRPYTISLPKPLMPVGDRPILEIVIKQLKKAGISKVIIAVGYLESLIKAYFGDGSKFGIEIDYSSENIPLGTAGPLNLIRPQLNETFLFLNGDILTDLPFASICEYHKNNGLIATVGISKRKVGVDFGIVRLNSKNEFCGWEEKPTLEYFVSMGVYVFEPKVLEFIPNDFYNVPDLIIKLHKANMKVGTYLHNGYWLDIGRVEDYANACRVVEKKELVLGNFDFIAATGNSKTQD